MAQRLLASLQQVSTTNNSYQSPGQSYTHRPTLIFNSLVSSLLIFQEEMLRSDHLGTLDGANRHV